MTPLARATAVCATLLLSAAARPQSPLATETRPDDAAEKLLGANPMPRRQASQWAAAHAVVAMPAIAAALGKPPASRFHYDGVRALGALPAHADIDAALVALVSRDDFAWKPQALESLADHAASGAKAAFLAALPGPVWRSRAAACRGLGRLVAADASDALRARLDDDEAGVRLEAARALAALGDTRGAPVIARDLTLSRRFLDADPGEVARTAAAAFLRDAFPKAAPPDGKSPLDASGLAALAARLRESDAASDAWPRLDTPHEPDVDLPFGVEARSCVAGDFYLRLGPDGRVVFGRDRLASFLVAPAATKPVVDALTAFDAGKSRRRLLGPITCDFERFGRRDGAAYATLVVGTGRRPPEFDALETAVASLIEQTLGADAAALHARRVAPFGAAR